jgi:hypothetical protein
MSRVIAIVVDDSAALRQTVSGLLDTRAASLPTPSA